MAGQRSHKLSSFLAVPLSFNLFPKVGQASRTAARSPRHFRADSSSRCPGSSKQAHTCDFDVVALGDICLDLLVPVAKMPIELNEHQALAGGIRVSPGGASNVAIMASRLGAAVGVADEWSPLDEFRGKRGPARRTEKMWRGVLKEVLEEEKIDCSGLVVDTNKETASDISICVVLVEPHGGHTFVADNELPTANIKGVGSAEEEEFAAKMSFELRRSIERAKLVTLDGYALDDINADTLCGALHLVAERNADFWFDPQSATGHLARSNPDLMNYLFNKMSALFINEEEFDALARARGFEQDDLSVGFAQSLFDSFPNIKFCIRKRGGDGSELLIPNYPVTPIPVCPVGSAYQDSTGAGDSLMAGMAAGIFRYGMSVREAAVLGSAAGAATCLNAGAGDNVGSRRQVIECLQSSPDPMAEQVAARLNGEPGVLQEVDSDSSFGSV